MFRRRDRQPRTDERSAQRLESLDPRWRPPVDKANVSRERFLTVLGQTEPGPTRERLEGLLPTIDEAVRRVTETAWRASNASAIAAGFDAEVATAELKAARREMDAAQHSGTDMGGLEDRVRILSERHRAIHDAINLSEDAGGRIDDLIARLETVVARSAAIVLRSGQGDDDVVVLDRDLHEVVVGLTALDDSMREFD